MKRVLYIVSFLLIAVCGFAETMVTHTCETWRKSMGYPYHYCYCKEESETFQFPLDRIVSDTMWFDANINDLKHGISAYWFADCAVTIEVYAFCSSKTPTISITVGANRMTSKSEEEINKKLAEMGGMAELVGSIVTPHIRVYPHGRGSGHVYCYPENQGPHSTCDSLLPVRRTMKYISSHADDVYVLEGKQLTKIFNSTNFNDMGSLRYLYKYIEKNGAIEKLKEMGLEEGDNIRIQNYEFEFWDEY